MILQTERLRISAPTKESFENRFKLLSNPQVAKFLGNGVPKTEVEVEEFLQNQLDEQPV